MSELNRRTLLRRAAAAAGGAALGGPFLGFVNRAALAAPPDDYGIPEFRRLRGIPDLRDGAVRLQLPEGFQYRSFHDTTTPIILDDGARLPGRHDGMGAFRGPNGNVVLVRNHEVAGSGTAFGDVSLAYDRAALGGTTTVEVTPFGEVVRSYASLNGTMSNCSGGQMPWGSWISCEETVNGPDVGPDFSHQPNDKLTRPHGYIFEVPVTGESDRQPITAAGRFAHESVAFDPHEGALYLTEDDFGFASGFYRYKPKNNPMQTGRLDNEGRLQMLRVKGQPNANLAAAQPLRATYEVEWVDIDDPTHAHRTGNTNEDALMYVANQGWEQGAAYFSRLEGSAYDNGVVYFTATQGGGPAETSTGPIADGFGNGWGQVWAYHTEAQILQLVYESPDRDTLDFPDNVTTSPRGTIILCEDHDVDNYLRGLTRGGHLFDIARNAIPGRTNEEFAGSTFSPDGHTLFVNIQASAGLTFAIWGPWERIGV
ncbi:MAG TPA: alkaline phosphatase PhoX [Micromonosporaceae bacterium]